MRKSIFLAALLFGGAGCHLTAAQQSALNQAAVCAGVQLASAAGQALIGLVSSVPQDSAQWQSWALGLAKTYGPQAVQCAAQLLAQEVAAPAAPAPAASVVPMAVKLGNVNLVALQRAHAVQAAQAILAHPEWLLH